MLDTVRRKLAAGVPLISHMGVELVSWSPGEVIVEAPLEPNLNTHGTAFGGSLYCVAAMAGWAMTHLTLRQAGVMPSVWVVRGEVEYLRPVRGRLRAVATLSAESGEALCVSFRQRGKAKAAIDIAVVEDGEVCVRLKALYAAVSEDPVP
jgi:thioesterase domain-containing protein